MSVNRQRISFTGLLICTALFAVPGSAKDNGKIAPDLANKVGLQDVIVQFRGEVSVARHQKVSDKGGVLKNELTLIKAAAYSLPASAIADLSDDPEVKYISVDRPLASTLNYATPAVGGLTA